MNRKIIFVFLSLITSYTIAAQQYKNWSSATILHELKKMPNTPNVLYIAAHPDDENTRLLAYLANERHCRTGYLSLTRGDGGQNLIGAEQGIELGLIRTQELLAARSVDGAEQFFSTAYDFGYSKTSTETFQIWNKQKVLSDAVFVIRKFKPDVIITRFPEDARAGHGHHAASGILGREAFFAAADPNQFPEHFKHGVGPWQAKRLLWNTFNFGSTNTTSEKQLKIDVGQYNVLMGKSYGEVAALSRSQHKSQGFGVPTNRGQQFEYFEHLAGDTATQDILEGIEISYNRFNGNLKPTDLGTQARFAYSNLDSTINDAIQTYDFITPAKNLPKLIALYKQLRRVSLAVNAEYKQKKMVDIILQCAGFYAEATTTQSFAYLADSLKINYAVNSRNVDNVKLKDVFFQSNNLQIKSDLTINKNFQGSRTIFLPANAKLTQPYWLQQPMNKGMFNVVDFNKIGQPDVDYEKVTFVLEILDELITLDRTIQYKYTDPVKGEIFQPVYIMPAVNVTVNPKVVINTPTKANLFEVGILPNKSFAKGKYMLSGGSRCDTIYPGFMWNDSLEKGKLKSAVITNFDYKHTACLNSVLYKISNSKENLYSASTMNVINYDHIPTIAYTSPAEVKVIAANINVTKKRIGYIEGAGDLVYESLIQLGYTVDKLTKNDINTQNLTKYNAIITGVRAYNTNAWMNDMYDVLMAYIKQGGNLIVQYNTSSNIGPIKAKIAPYNFTISRNRITNESAKVNFINTKETLLNFPNKIADSDFNDWVQERSVYEAIDLDSAYRKVFVMNDEGEKQQDGSLITAAYGKGNFTYCSLALFRQLPAGVVGAYKLLANMIEAKPKKP